MHFWNFYAQHVNTVFACRHFSRAVQQVLLQISRAVVRDTDEGDGEMRTELGVSPDVPVEAWKELGDLAIPAGAVRWYGDTNVRLILSWFWQTTFRSPHEVLWVSQFQLYIDFMLSGELGPVKLDVWASGTSVPFLDILAIPFQTRTRWFCKVLKECLRHIGQPLTYRYCQPWSHALSLHTGCLAVPWPRERLAVIDNWILEHCPAGIRRASTALASLPFGVKDVRFPPVWLTCA